MLYFFAGTGNVRAEACFQEEAGLPDHVVMVLQTGRGSGTPGQLWGVLIQQQRTKICVLIQDFCNVFIKYVQGRVSTFCVLGANFPFITANAYKFILKHDFFPH